MSVASANLEIINREIEFFVLENVRCETCAKCDNIGLFYICSDREAMVGWCDKQWSCENHDFKDEKKVVELENLLSEWHSKYLIEADA